MLKICQGRGIDDRLAIKTPDQRQPIIYTLGRSYSCHKKFQCCINNKLFIFQELLTYIVIIIGSWTFYKTCIQIKYFVKTLEMDKIFRFLIIQRYTLPKNRTPRSYIHQYETSYLQDGSLGIQNAAMAMTSWDQINENWRFQKM